MSAVAIVEDHKMVADTLAAQLDRSGVTAAMFDPARHGDDLLANLLAARPKLVLLDLDLGDGRDGTSLVAPLADSGAKVLLVTGSDNLLRIAVGIEAGAIGYQPKAQGFDALLRAIFRALRTSGPLDVQQRTDLLAGLADARRRRLEKDAPLRLLTERERSTLEALTHGIAVTELSRSWEVSEATVRTHVRGVLTKLGVRSQLEAVAIANRHRWFGRDRRRAPSPPKRTR